MGPEFTFPKAELDVVKRYYTCATRILEYGTGGSTYFASQLSGKRIVAIESDYEWITGLSKDIRESNPQSFPNIIYVDIGPTGGWGRPINAENWNKFVNYSLAPWEQLPNIDPDVILIDGRFRTACFVAALLHIEKPTVVLFDDYVDRSHYHAVENFVEPSEIVGRLAIFHLTPDDQPSHMSAKFIRLFFNTSEKDKIISNQIWQDKIRLIEKEKESIAKSLRRSNKKSVMLSENLGNKSIEINKLKSKERALRQKLFFLSLPWIILTLPLSLPLIGIIIIRKKLRSRHSASEGSRGQR